MNVIVTGASQGIGLELVRLLVSATGVKVLAVTRNIQPLKELGDFENLRYLALDIGDLQSYEALIKLADSYLGQEVDVLINNAGMLINKPVGEFDTDDFNAIFDTNVKGLFFIVQRLLPYFQNPSHIVNIASMGGFQGSSKFPGLSLYSASKGAVCILTECLAEELKTHGISVNALALGAVDTAMLRKAFPGYKAPVSAAEMAQYIMNFSLTGHKYLNGKIIPVSLSVP